MSDLDSNDLMTVGDLLIRAGHHYQAADLDRRYHGDYLALATKLHGRALEIIKQKTNGLPQSGETKEDNNGTSNHRPDNPDSGEPHHLDGSETKPVIRSPGGRILPSLPTD